MSRVKSPFAICARMAQFVFLMLFVLPGTIRAESAAKSPAYTPICGFEFLTYRSSDVEKSFVEVLSQIPTENFQFVKSRKGFYASFRVTISLLDSQGVEIERESFVDSVHVASFKEIDDQRPPELLRFGFLVTPGVYQARVTVTDLETLTVTGFNKKLTVPDYHNDNLELSDLQIASAIVPTQEANVLVKNRHKVLPNVTRIYGFEADLLHVYGEVYNLKISEEDSGAAFDATYTIRDHLGLDVKSVTISKPKPGPSSFLTASIPITELTTGKYELVLDVNDPGSSQKSRRIANFIVIRSDINPEQYSQLLSQADSATPTY